VVGRSLSTIFVAMEPSSV